MNDQIRKINASLDTNDSLLLLCECEQSDCLQRVEVPEVVYREVRKDSERFVVASGHEDADVERISASPEGYAIVRAALQRLRVVEADDVPWDDGSAPIGPPSPLPAA